MKWKVISTEASRRELGGIEHGRNAAGVVGGSAGSTKGSLEGDAAGGERGENPKK